jgi:hypothetical protein
MKPINQVYQTNDYHLFKTLQGNRVVNELHVMRLKKSFEDSYLLSPILVNEQYQIIDGQHRFKAAKELGLPINFIIQHGYGLQEIQKLNTNSKNWTKGDYLNAYCDLGVESYLQMRKFIRDFPDFSLTGCEIILTGTFNGANQSDKSAKDTNLNKSGSVKNFGFQSGGLKIPNLKKSYEDANKIMMLKDLYEGYNRTVFIQAMIQLFRHPNYNHATFMKKIKGAPSLLVHCVNVPQTKLLIEEIYNYRSREKVSLRF